MSTKTKPPVQNRCPKCGDRVTEVNLGRRGGTLAYCQSKQCDFEERSWEDEEDE